MFVSPPIVYLLTWSPLLCSQLCLEYHSSWMEFAIINLNDPHVVMDVT